MQQYVHRINGPGFCHCKEGGFAPPTFIWITELMNGEMCGHPEVLDILDEQKIYKIPLRADLVTCYLILIQSIYLPSA